MTLWILVPYIAMILYCTFILVIAIGKFFVIPKLYHLHNNVYRNGFAKVLNWFTFFTVIMFGLGNYYDQQDMKGIGLIVGIPTTSLLLGSIVVITLQTVVPAIENFHDSLVRKRL